MTLQPFLTDGALFVSDSWLSALTQCPREFYYLYGLRRVAKTTKPALIFGSAVHEALAERYNTDPNLADPTTESRMIEAAGRVFESTPVLDDDHRNLGFCSKVIQAYNNEYPLESFEVMPFDAANPTGMKLVEQNFAVEFDTINGYPVFYTGLLDFPYTQNHGELWVMDHKTTSVMSDSYFRDLAVAPQQWGYCWAAMKTLARVPAGYTINAIPTNKPSKTGRVTETKDGGLKIEFQRASTFINADMLLEWEENTHYQIKEFFHYVETGFFPTHRKNHCVGKYGCCQFYDVCTLPMNQRGVMLASGLFEDKVRRIADEV
jgi:hypothetical protein